MPKKSIKVEFKNFIKGLITEASPVNFPPEASSDEENFQLNRDGTRDRRLGLDYESEATLRNLPISVSQLLLQDPVTFEWKNVKSDSGTVFLVLQTDQVLTFFNLQTSSLSTSGYVGTVTLSSFPVSVAYSFASVDGKLIVAAGVDTVCVVEYTGSSFTASYQALKTRDVWGVEESGTGETDTTYRSSSLSAAHNYNLYNQSWGIPRKNSSDALSDPVSLYQGSLGVYPSNSETVWPGLQYQPVATGQVPFERVYPNLYTEVIGATTITPKGYFIIDVLRRGESRSAAVVANKAKYSQLSLATFSAPADYSAGGATVVAEFAGRVFYAGFNGAVTSGDKRSPDLSNYVFFSQLVKSSPDIVKCYQEGDPTSRESNDVVETDGGFIRLSGVDRIVSLVNLSSHLIVIATNGVWSVSGGSDYGFSATNFKTTRLSSFGALGARCVVEDSSRALYWSEDGIYAVGKDQFGEYTATNLTQSTIQTFYESISNTAKEKAIGVYDSVGKKIRWVYHEGTRFTSSSETKELVLDLTINAFYVNRIMNLPDNSAEAISAFRSTPFQSGTGNTLVLADEEEVFAGVDQIVVPSSGREAGLQTTRYLCVVLVAGVPKYTFGYYNNPYFKDWEQVDNIGVDAKAYLVTGDYTADDSSIHKQVPYLTIHFRRTESGVDAELNPLSPSGCYIRTMWDWANGYQSNKWSPLVQAYRYRKQYTPSGPDDDYDTGFEIVTSRNKMRGRGKAFSLYFESEPNKDCRIVGWSLALNGNSFT
jgi:hypothetical protein